MLRKQFKTVICLLLVPALVSACAPSHTGSAERAQPGEGVSVEQASAILPALAELEENRAVSIAQSSEQLGRDALMRSTFTVEIGESLTLLSTPTEFAWAIWRFNPELAYLDNLQLLMDVPAGNEAWVAIADYGSDRWQFSGPFDGNELIELNDSAQRSSAGNFHIAVFCAGGDDVEVKKLVLHNETHWQVLTLASEGDVGRYSSMVETINGPAIACYDATNEDLLFIHSGNAIGLPLSTWTTERIDSDGSVGQYCSLAMIYGNPAISYYDQTNLALKYARSDVTIGGGVANWRFKLVDDGVDETGSFTSLASIDGRPAISYYNSTDQDLMYAISGNITGIDPASLWTTVKVHQTLASSTVGFGTSLANVNGKPQIAYYEFFPYRMHFAWSDTPQGDHTSEWHFYEMTAIDPVGANFDLIEFGGSPLISFYDTDAGSLRLLSSGTGTPDAAFRWSQHTIDSGSGPAPDLGGFSSMAIIGDRPWISYYDYQNTALRIARPDSTTVNFSTQWDSIEVDNAANVGKYTSVASINGWPAISYFDETNKDLKYAILWPPGS
jgi:hypothetical protein